MNKHEPPRTFGVFKPTGHVVVAFTDSGHCEQAVGQLQAAGLDGDGITRYTPREMLAQSEIDLAQASALASVGQELNLVKFHRELAVKGCHFLVVPTPDDDRVQSVTKIARGGAAVTAQHYGMLIITDLVGDAEGRAQVFESPDRGLDSQISTN